MKNDPEVEQEKKNRSSIDSLRETFAPMAERLTPEVEPATVYTPVAGEPDREE